MVVRLIRFAASDQRREQHSHLLRTELDMRPPRWILHVEGKAFEAFCRNVASAVGDLPEGDGAGEIHIEIIAHASMRAVVAA